jgi:hypothetical protein
LLGSSAHQAVIQMIPQRQGAHNLRFGWDLLTKGLRQLLDQ